MVNIHRLHPEQLNSRSAEVEPQSVVNLQRANPFQAATIALQYFLRRFRKLRGWHDFVQ